MKKNFCRAFKTKLIMFLCLSSITFSSCSDKIDDSNLYTFKGDVLTSYFEKNEEFSNFSFLLKKVKLSNYTKSTLSELLSTRGNYTCFAPTNEAIQIYLDSIYNTVGYDIQQIPDSTASNIAKNCIVDNGSADAYMIADFTIGALEKTTMNNRYITISFTNEAETNKSIILVNSHSKIIQSDTELENGVIHKVDRVLAPSNASLPSLIGTVENLQIFNLLLKETGWDKSMTKYRDEAYEAYYLKNPTGKNMYGEVIKAPEHRNYGYTAFVETDSIFMEQWNIEKPVLINGILQNGTAILEQIKAKCAEAYPNAKSTNLKDENNAVNQFISYHLLSARIPYDKLVIHYAEIGYAYKNPENLSINCYEYYETMGSQRRLLKITEGKSTEGKRINRHCTYDYTDYTEIDVDRKGILIQESNKNYDYNALNGYYYALNEILIYDQDVPNKVLNERIRFDMSSFLPEMITNGFRRISDAADIHIPNGYFENITFNGDGTNYTYLSGFGQGWPDLQGDEHNITGQYDMTIKLPPVPFEGTYEIRWAIPTLDSRGMAQFYIGTNKNNLPAVGLPIDLRLYPKNPTIGWESDKNKDEVQINENDKTMRNH
ncbi:MAG: fasciclin domain-containing protein, partial [Bacteroidaceae bacterium]